MALVLVVVNCTIRSSIFSFQENNNRSLDLGHVRPGTSVTLNKLLLREFCVTSSTVITLQQSFHHS